MVMGDERVGTPGKLKPTCKGVVLKKLFRS